MYGRVTWLEGSPSQAGEAIAALREVIPQIEAAAGFEELLFLVDRDGGRALALTLWATREDLARSEELASRMRNLPIARRAESGAERFELAVRIRAPGR